MIENHSAVEYLRDTFGRGPHEHEHNCAGSLGYGWVHYGLIRAMRPDRVLAIGSRYGFIPSCMAAALSDNRHGRMDFVDANYDAATDGEKAASGQGWWTAHSFGDLDPIVDMHLMRTDEFFPACEHQYGYVHIDAGHTYELASYDFRESAKRLAPDGVIAMHDALNQTHVSNEGPGRVIQDVAHDWDIIRFPGRYGMVVMQRKPVTIQEITFADLASFMAQRKGYEKVVDEENSVHFGAFVDGVLVGTCTAQRMTRQPSIATFRHDYVVPAMRRRGIYSQLFAARAAWCRDCGVRFVHTRCTNEALPVYLKRGFEVPPDWPHLHPVVAEI